MAGRKRGSNGAAIGASVGDNGTLRSIDGGPSDSDSTVAADSAAGGGTGGTEFVNPGSIAASDGTVSGEPRTKRKYTKRASSGDKAPVDVGTIEKLLHSVHLGLSILTASPELALSPDENSSMAKAISDVARHYPVFQASEKVTDWGNLILCAAFIYGPRIIAISNNKRARRVAKAQATPQAPAQMPNGRALNPQAVEQFTKVKIPGTSEEVSVPVGGWPH